MLINWYYSDVPIRPLILLFVVISSLILPDSYVFYFNPKPDWSQCYAKGPEIQQYILDTTKKFGLDEKVQLNTKVISSIWKEKQGHWQLKLQRGDAVFEDKADVVLDGSGILKYACVHIWL